eukprot:TRINITY_DN40999_c0_g1_i1.p1 TRINITY_DN40999_c0_g1~~TRINITY_DN40999_c0_g1_i1.p1  ORF type:complete len:520 (-),score=63.38 TRINITY_DN40999_c0_g1_i1:878-2437(-)
MEVPAVEPPPGMDPAFYCLSLLRRREFDRSIAQSTALLTKNPYDQCVWYIKARALTMKNWIDDTEMEEEGVAELLLDENHLANVPRPGTSLTRPRSANTAEKGNQGRRPMGPSGRPLSGFAGPGSSSGRPGSKSGGRMTPSVEQAFQGSRPGTSRPVTGSGRFVRLGTASMRADPSGPFIDAQRLDFAKYAARQHLAKVLCDYILYHDHNSRVAIELASEATKAVDFKDWWWKARLGKCYYQLGLLRDAESQFKSSLRQQPMVVTYLELGKTYLKLDQPLAALQLYGQGVEHFPGDTHLLLAIARVHDLLGETDKSAQFYKRVLELDSSNIESIACLASNHFYEDQPEIALRLYRRLLQMGVNNTELWNNLGLCCFYASQYDMTLSCFERALALANDDNMADIWYNIGQVAIGIGDLGLAYQAFKVAISVDSNHAESFNNLGILELRKGNVEQARTNFQTAARLGEHMHEPLFNGGLLAFKLGDFQESFTLTTKALSVYDFHAESLELKRQLKQHFTSL